MDHPNIVTIYEVGSVDQVHFYSMQLIRGSSLAARLRRGERLAPPAAARLVRGVADAVAYAHDLGVLHLDLKPANVLVDEYGLPHLVDFGLARLLAGASEVDNDEVSGTPAYMAPEQAVVRASKLSTATDVWALGVILYELLTGRPPFLGETCTDTLNLVLQGRARAPDHFAPGLPRDLEGIVLRCLYKDPLQRYRTARALGADLDRYLAGHATDSHPRGAARRWLGRMFR